MPISRYRHFANLRACMVLLLAVEITYINSRSYLDSMLSSKGERFVSGGCTYKVQTTCCCLPVLDSRSCHRQLPHLHHSLVCLGGTSYFSEPGKPILWIIFLVLHLSYNNASFQSYFVCSESEKYLYVFVWINIYIL